MFKFRMFQALDQLSLDVNRIFDGLGVLKEVLYVEKTKFEDKVGATRVQEMLDMKLIEAKRRENTEGYVITHDGEKFYSLRRGLI